MTLHALNPRPVYKRALWGWVEPCRSKRSRFMTLFHTATKSLTNLSWASELLPPDARGLLADCDAGRLDDAGVDALQVAMVDAGVRDRAERTIADLVLRSHRALDGLGVDPGAELALRELAEGIAWRTA